MTGEVLVRKSQGIADRAAQQGPADRFFAFDHGTSSGQTLAYPGHEFTTCLLRAGELPGHFEETAVGMMIASFSITPNFGAILMSLAIIAPVLFVGLFLAPAREKPL